MVEHPEEISNEYVRGLVEGEGTFTFSPSGNKKIPVFCLKMHVRDKNLLELVRNKLGLKNKVYEYNHQRKDGVKEARRQCS